MPYELEEGVRSRSAGRRGLSLFILTGLLFPASALRAESSVWRTSTFLEFVDGIFSDGGVNSYVAADGSVRLINLWDLNNDGNFDIPVACGQDHDEEVDLVIYLAGESGFDPARKIRLPTDGAISATVADLNGDGWLEVIVANRFDGETTDLDCLIYWGSSKGFLPEPTTLPAKAATAIAVADLDSDGCSDVVVANRGVDYHTTVDHFQKSFVYWGATSGFSADHRSTLNTINCADAVISDVDADGHLDIVFANEGNTESESGVTIYFGNSKRDFTGRNPMKLPGMYSSALSIEDLDRDGHADIVLANKYRLGEKPEIPSTNVVQSSFVKSYIYWGASNGYSADRRMELPTIGANDVAVGDLDGDGLADLAFANGAAKVSFVYWNSPRGFSPNRRSQIHGPGAHGVAIDDLNEDGHAELLLANYASAGTFDICSFIYWGSPEGFRRDRRTELPTSGAAAAVTGDLDGDGKKDVLFVNKIEGTAYSGGTTGSVASRGPTTSWIYWGDDQGRFDPARRQGFPTVRGAYAHVSADLDVDGQVDVLFAQFGKPGTIIFRGSTNGPQPAERSVVPGGSSGMARTSDFNRDGYLDLLLRSAVIYGQQTGYSENHRFVLSPQGMYPGLADLNRDGWPDVISPLWHQVIIYWNSPAGFDNQRRTVLSLPGKRVSRVETADLNDDGFLDLVLAVYADARKPLLPGEKAVIGSNPNADSYIYWGSDEGYSHLRRTSLPTVGPHDLLAADLNTDGYIDLFFSSYLAGIHRHFPGTIFWNGSEGFDPVRRTYIPAFSGCGTVAADCNLDGFQDLVVANHTRVGNHRSDLWLYWGSADGYAENRRTSLPAAGPHFLSAAPVGHIYNRSDRYDYISPPHDASRPRTLKSISWKADTPFRTRVELQIRTSATNRGLASAAWQGPDGPSNAFRAPGPIAPGVGGKDRWIQYRASLISPNSANTPVLREVSIEYE